ncbi:tetratricopeptide repeat protein [Brevundimonas sp. 2R-24]|uniref:Tetratricopeptide repeat protein n=1 Tax=Peiella sedimenti TaxID=3061083 RepID=A0ABT8SHT8_9CAUL|nr:tetratricopeptide repeat protein [Caulobacteraceae bacterium XZ-24]
MTFFWMICGLTALGAGLVVLIAARRASATAADRTDQRVLLGGVLGMGVLAAGLYAVTGAPGTPDQPYAQRVEAWSQELETLDATRLAAVAERAAERAPDDATAWAFLGRARMAAGDHLGAVSAFRRSLSLGGASAEVWARLGESLYQAGGQQFSEDAVNAFGRALQMDPAQPVARYRMRQAAAEFGLSR